MQSAQIWIVWIVGLDVVLSCVDEVVVVLIQTVIENLRIGLVHQERLDVVGQGVEVPVRVGNAVAILVQPWKNAVDIRLALQVAGPVVIPAVGVAIVVVVVLHEAVRHDVVESQWPTGQIVLVAPDEIAELGVVERTHGKVLAPEGETLEIARHCYVI